MPSASLNCNTEEVVPCKDDILLLPNVGRDLRLELFHKFGAVVVYISGIGGEEMSEHTNKILRENMAKQKYETIK